MCQEDDATRSAGASTTTAAPEGVARGAVWVVVAPSADPEVWAVVRARTTSARSNRKWSDQVRPGVPRFIAASCFLGRYNCNVGAPKEWPVNVANQFRPGRELWQITGTPKWGKISQNYSVPV